LDILSKAHVKEILIKKIIQITSNHVLIDGEKI